MIPLTAPRLPPVARRDVSQPLCSPSPPRPCVRRTSSLYSAAMPPPLLDFGTEATDDLPLAALAAVSLLWEAGSRGSLSNSSSGPYCPASYCPEPYCLSGPLP